MNAISHLNSRKRFVGNRRGNGRGKGRVKEKPFWKVRQASCLKEGGRPDLKTRTANNSWKGGRGFHPLTTLCFSWFVVTMTESGPKGRKIHVRTVGTYTVSVYCTLYRYGLTDTHESKGWHLLQESAMFDLWLSTWKHIKGCGRYYYKLSTS